MFNMYFFPLLPHTLDEPMSTSVSSEEANIVTEIKTPEEAISGSPEALDSSSSSYKGSVKTKSFFNKDTQFSTDPISSPRNFSSNYTKEILSIYYYYVVVVVVVSNIDFFYVFKEVMIRRRKG